MSKRAAEVQLTQDNVDDFDNVPDEEPGTFEVASEDQLKQRVIKKARRNKPLGDTTGPSIFAGLKGLQSSSLERPPLTTDVASVAAKTTSPAAPLQGDRPIAKSPYLIQLKALNESVSEWIKKHITTNPYVDLTPIFKDYQTHLSGIEAKYKNLSKSDDSQESEGKALETEPEHSENPSSATESQESTQEESQGEATPQILDDDDSLMSVRAKLFYKKGAEYCELGVGTLKVQSLGDKSIRLLLRNDTATAKVILNVRVTSNIPVSSKNNNVFLVCVANPPLAKNPEDTPVSYLIRVKTAQLADKLFTTIKENAE